MNGQIEYIAIDDPRIALEVGDRIFRHLDHLADYPQLGRDGRRAGTRELVIPRTPFVMVYRIKLDRIVKLRLLHGAQRWPPHE